MTVREFIDMAAGRIRIIDTDTGKCYADFVTNNISRIPHGEADIVYVSSSLMYFCNSKKAEYSASINIYI